MQRVISKWINQKLVDWSVVWSTVFQVILPLKNRLLLAFFFFVTLRGDTVADGAGSDVVLKEVMVVGHTKHIPGKGKNSERYRARIVTNRSGGVRDNLSNDTF